MKAAYLLLCLALARDGAGHIFRRPVQQMEGLIVQPLEYINQQYKQYLEKQQAASSQEENQWSPRWNQQQTQNPELQSQNYEQLKQSSEQQNQYAQQRWTHQHSQEQYKKSEESNESAQQHQHQNQKHQKTLQHKKQHYQGQQSDSTSSESKSHENIRINEYVAPVYTSNVQGMKQYNRQGQMLPSWKVITWNGIKVPNRSNSPVQKEDIEKIFAGAYETLHHVSEEDKMMFHEAYEAAAQTANEEAHDNATQLLRKNQYPVEEYTIKTDDGYWVTLFRIPQREATVTPRPVVFLMHGLMGSADDWLLMGPGKSLAYLLSDAGYDVWLGNSRGSKYSRRHVSKHPAQADFWQFSTDEIALHDLPAMIDFALRTSGQEKLYYVGHNQGATVFFALASTRPEYNSKIIMMHAMSPMVYMSQVRSPVFRMLAPNSPLHHGLHHELGHGQFKPNKEVVQTIGGAMCEKEIGCKNVCSNAYFVVSGVNVESLDVTDIPVIMGHLPSGASTRQMKHYAQGVASQQFTKYDFGWEINEKVYGSSEPPKYMMEKVKVPVALYYSEEDWLAHPTDVERLASELPQVTDSYKVPDQHFSGIDFQFSKKAETVYQRLIDSINQTQQKNVY